MKLTSDFAPIVRRQLPPFPYYVGPQSKFRTVSPYYDVVLGRKMGGPYGLGEVGVIPSVYDAARNFNVTIAGLPVPAGQVARRANLVSLSQVIDYARGGWQAAKRSRDAVTAASPKYAVFTDVMNRYRWASDLATWMATQSPTTAEYPALLANLKGALETADRANDEATGRVPPPPIVTTGGGARELPPLVEPPLPPLPPPVAEAGFMSSPMVLAAVGFGAMLLLRKRRNPSRRRRRSRR